MNNQENNIKEILMVADEKECHYLSNKYKNISKTFEIEADKKIKHILNRKSSHHFEMFLIYMLLFGFLGGVFFIVNKVFN